MNFLRKYWPTPFKIERKNSVSFVVQLVAFLIVCAVFGWIISLLSKLAVVGIIFAVISSIIEIYAIIGVVLCILKFVGAIK